MLKDELESLGIPSRERDQFEERDQQAMRQAIFLSLATEKQNVSEREMFSLLHSALRRHGDQEIPHGRVVHFTRR